MTREEAIYKANHLRKVHPSICIDAEDFWETVISALEQEPKTGHWIFKSSDPDTGISNTIWCSECNNPFAGIYKSYCPNCGAKME